MVRIRNSEGQYLARDVTQWRFSTNAADAVVLDYSEAELLGWLQIIASTRGLALNVVPIDPGEVHEACDCCGQLEAASDIFFDGLAFLCERCRKRSSRRSRR